MNFFDYIGISKERFIEDYLHTGYVSESIHKEFPLNIFTYSRKTVHENKWDAVTSKCRGIIVNRETGDIVARPFEKFHNYGSTTPVGELKQAIPASEPYVIEKMDGFMATMYRWQGKNYIASKGSFHSIHAKWATAELRRTLGKTGDPDQELWPGWTAVFEGLQRDLRVVVDYGQRQGLVFLALINNETGEEVHAHTLKAYAELAGFMSPYVYPMTLKGALDSSVKTRFQAEEGYVLTWYREGMTPFRLKLKFVEYLRLHRMVTGVSPKRIWEVLSQAHLKADLDEYLSNSTPWFSAFVNKWVNALRGEYQRIKMEADAWFAVTRFLIEEKKAKFPYENMGAERKEYAKEFMHPEKTDLAPVLFAMLDGKDVSAVIWKRVKALTSNGHPMVDAHNT